MSGAKKCGPHHQCAPHTHDRQTQARASANAKPTHAAQSKPHAPAQPKRTPPAPPVYRPQPTPKVLQKKTPPGRTVENTREPTPRPAHSPSRPSAPPVYRPEPKGVAQPKAAPGALARPPRATPQMRTAAAPAQPRPAVPRAAAPSHPARPSSVVQPMKRKRDEDDEERYEVKKKRWEKEKDTQYTDLKRRHGKNKPPPTNPRKRAPSPEFTYHYDVSEFFTNRGLPDLADRYMDYIEKVSGKSIGDSSGRGEEDEYDESYVDIPIGIRPAAPTALWNTVYAGLKNSQKYPSLQWVDCEEHCSNRVYVDKKTKKEEGKTKRPPMCHIVAYNHIKWAVSWLYGNPSHYLVGGTYKGPDVLGFPDDTWRDLVWHKSNLRPGHASCNSYTASQAKGNPSTKVGNDAKNYVIYRLKKLKPNWF